MSTCRRAAGDRSVLVIFPGALGDIVCLLPAIEALAQRDSEARFELMAAPWLARFFARRSVFEVAHSIDSAAMAALFANEDADLAKVRSLFSRFHHIYSFFASDNATYRQRLTLACAGAASFHRFRPDHSGHVSAGYLAELGLVPELGGRPSSVSASGTPLASGASTPRRIVFTPEDLAAAERLAASLGLARGRFVLLMPGSGGRHKNWPREKFSALAQMVSERLPVAVLLGPAEHETRSLWEKQRLALIADVELPVAAALIAGALAFVGNDSGVSHLAAAMGVPGVVVFGPTDPVRWAPLGNVTVIARPRLAELDFPEVGAVLNKVIQRHGALGDVSR
jgi:ADP-heptose:LPS heptosyltransferase